jgi:hypothetical protein
MAIFNSYVSLPEGIWLIYGLDCSMKNILCSWFVGDYYFLHSTKPYEPTIMKDL